MPSVPKYIVFPEKHPVEKTPTLVRVHVVKETDKTITIRGWELLAGECYYLSDRLSKANHRICETLEEAKMAMLLAIAEKATMLKHIQECIEAQERQIEQL